MYKKYNYIFYLIIVFLFALFFRVYKLSLIPYGFHVDEAKVAWNAYSILKTGKDDKGNSFPLYYDSFGDYRPTGLIYLVIPFIALLGNSVFSVRLPFAILGAATGIVLFFLISEIFNYKNKKLALFGSMFLSFNPWHIITSRATSESVVVIFLTLLGIYFFIKLFKSDKLLDMFLSYFFMFLSFFFYHNIRILGPIFYFLIWFLYIILFKLKIKLKQILVLISLILTCCLIFIAPEARSRASQVSLKSDFKVLYEITKMPVEEGSGHVFTARVFHNKIASYIRRFAEEYKEYFSTSFLIGETAKPVRYAVPQVGLITYIEFILFVLGIYFGSKKKETIIILLLLVISPLPAAVTIEDTPNLQRAIFMIPFLIFFIAYGFYNLTKLQGKWKFITVLLIFLWFLNFIYFSHMYLVHQRMSIATYYRDGGNVELVNELKEIVGKYKNIVITNRPDDLYPWIAFLNKFNPKEFNQSYKEMVNGVRYYKNYVFSTDKCPSNQAIKSGNKDIDLDLYVDVEGCEIDNNLSSIAKVNLIEVIHRPDGSPPYYLRTIQFLK